MFETRPHSIVSGASLNKRKLHECLVQFANKLSRLEDDNLGRYTIGRDRLEIDATIKFHKNQMSNSSFQTIAGKSSAGNAYIYLGGIRMEVENTSGSGYYWLNWSLTGEVKDNAAVVGAFPFAGTELLTGLGDYIEKTNHMQGFYLSENYSGAATHPTPQDAYGITSTLCWNPGLKFSLGGSGSFYLGSTSAVIGIIVYTNDGGTVIVEKANANIIERVR
tara:strand:+ start:1669 stop:2328 length:660 start_codon:yes stop_codon:yes gene_type:complete